VLAVLYCGAAAIFVAVATVSSPLVALGALPWLLLAWRTFRVGIYPSRDGVVVRNVLRSRRIPWSEISSFNWGRWWGFPIGGAYLLDGGFVRAFALNPPLELKKGTEKAVPRVLDALNEELERARAAGLASPTTAAGRPARSAPSGA
jgi:hypothetical protein